jgi:PIN domain nuclease of toxin-antitoxin system
MKVLLDTCALIWATLSPAALSPQAREAIADEGNVILVSAASAWEIATKVRLGRLPGAEKLEQDYLAVMDEAGYTLLPIDTASALRAVRLTAQHKDPFDRMIAAQALALDVPVLSSDLQLDQFGVRRIW